MKMVKFERDDGLQVYVNPASVRYVVVLQGGKVSLHFSDTDFLMVALNSAEFLERLEAAVH